MNRRRSREEIQEVILRKAVEPGASVSSIIDSGALGWKLWKAISADMVKRGLLTMRGGKYLGTEKGIEWLRLRERMGKI